MNRLTGPYPQQRKTGLGRLEIDLINYVDIPVRYNGLSTKKFATELDLLNYQGFNNIIQELTNEMRQNIGFQIRDDENEYTMDLEFFTYPVHSKLKQDPYWILIQEMKTDIEDQIAIYNRKIMETVSASFMEAHREGKVVDTQEFRNLHSGFAESLKQISKSHASKIRNLLLDSEIREPYTNLLGPLRSTSDIEGYVRDELTEQYIENLTELGLEIVAKSSRYSRNRNLLSDRLTMEIFIFEMRKQAPSVIRALKIDKNNVEEVSNIESRQGRALEVLCVKILDQLVLGWTIKNKRLEYYQSIYSKLGRD